MSQVKNQPATPLPWTTIEDGRARVKLVHVETTHDNEAGAGLPVCSINVARIGDAEYLAHAANAYPQLVEALKSALIFVRTDAKAEVERGVNAMDGYACNREQKLMGLLRDLGEAS